MRSARARESTGEPVELEPMSSIERRIVHLRLEDEPGVSTRSEGEEPYRYVVVDPELTALARAAARDAGPDRDPGSRPRRARVHLDESLARCRSSSATRRSGRRRRLGRRRTGDPDRGCAARPRASSCSRRRAQVRLPRVGRGGLPERRGSSAAAPRSSQSDSLRRGGCEGAGAASGRGRVVPAAGTSGRGGDPARRPVGGRRCGRARSAQQLGGGEPERRIAGCWSSRRSSPTPPGFPRRAGIARKRPLAYRADAQQRPSAREERMFEWPGGSTRSRTRRAGSARRRPRSTSPPASPRPASARSSSTSTRRRTRPPGSASSANGTLELRPARRRAARRSSRSRRASRTSGSSRRSPSSPAPRSSSRGATTASASSPSRSSGARDGYAFVFLDCPPSLGPLTVNALARRRPRARAGAGRVLRARGPLAARSRSVDIIKARLNPQLGDRRRAADDGRRAARGSSADVERRGARATSASSCSRRPCRASVRLAEAPSHGLPAIAYDRRSAGAEAYWKVAMELVERS